MLESGQRREVVVVGARAAGAATALLLARLGHDVLLLDKAVFPADTLSTHQIARPGVVQLNRWGLLPAVLASGAPAIRTISFAAGGETVRRTVKDKAGVDLLVAPRRHILDAIVADAAFDAGADVRHGVTVTGVSRSSSGRVTGVVGHSSSGREIAVEARLVVGADGLASTVARAVDAPVTEQRGNGGSVEYAYYAGVPWGGIELYAANRALVGVFPTHRDEACIWIGSPSADARAARRASGTRSAAFAGRVAASAPELWRRLRRARRVSPVQGMLRMPNHVRRAHGPGWALVGDAGYHRDAVTGHGISDAYRDAELLALAAHDVLAGQSDETTALAAYEAERNSAVREVFDITCALATYPPVPEFVRLQKELSKALDTEATLLAARPVPGHALPVSA